jgi:hypothetical protein
MLFDLDLIKKVYAELPTKVQTARNLLNRPLTLAEKILYSHTFKPAAKPYERGKDYVDFAPDRVAMQDATAQMALLQFDTCGREQVAVPSSVHCDLTLLLKPTGKYMIFFPPSPINMASVSGNRVQASSTRWYWRIMLSRAV